MESKLQKLQAIDKEIKILEGTVALLSWDQETYMPPKGIETRSKQSALIQKIIHEKKTSDGVGNLLKDLGATGKEQDLSAAFSTIEKAYLRNFSRQYQRAIKLSSDFVANYAEKTSVAQSIWAEARAKNDFSLFSPYLQEVLDLTKEKAELIGYKDHLYDALLDEYEPWMTTAQTTEIFKKLKPQLVALSKKIAQSTPIDDRFLNTSFPVAQQKAFNSTLLQDLGYSLDRGRLDESAHPFTISIGSDDVRITTRYNEFLVKSSIFGTIHECGHGLYELGMGENIKNSLLAEGSSLGIHESQSRTWENILGRSYTFWQYYFPKLKVLFPEALSGIDLPFFYKAINKSEPSLIRVEADEVTYGLHVILRFELELQLLTGEVEVKDLPEIWKSKMGELIGVKPETDTDGVLQDVHWSIGIFGYFPTYALGNLYGAQFFETMKKEIPDIDQKIAAGDFQTLLNWYQTNIHQHGAVYSANELCHRVTGEALKADYFTNYLEQKYSEIYQLK